MQRQSLPIKINRPELNDYDCEDCDDGDDDDMVTDNDDNNDMVMMGHSLMHSPGG